MAKIVKLIVLLSLILSIITFESTKQQDENEKQSLSIELEKIYLLCKEQFLNKLSQIFLYKGWNIITREPQIIKGQQIERNQQIIESQYNALKIDLLHQWYQNRFSLSNIQQISHIIYKLVAYDNTNFQGLPFHIVVWVLNQLKHQIFNISKMNNQIYQILVKINNMYPPGSFAAPVAHHQIANSFKNQIDSNLFHVTHFNNHKQLLSEISAMNKRAISHFQQFTNFVQPLCQIKGKRFISNKKFNQDVSDKVKYFRDLIRIFQKTFKRTLNPQTFSSKLQSNLQVNQFGIQRFLQIYYNVWIEDIDNFLIENAEKGVIIKCRISDLIRAKVEFTNEQDIYFTINLLNQEAIKQNYSIIELQNRLNSINKDIVMKIKIGDSIAELQLALLYDDIQYKFSHSLYEIYRSPNGPLFGALLWLSRLEKLSILDRLTQEQVIKSGKNYELYNKEQSYLEQVYTNLQSSHIINFNDDYNE